MNARKLLLHEKVEVRQLEEGLGGSWHPGVVVDVSDSCRKVEYDELLCESGSSKLIESIPVTGAIEGLYQRPCVKFNYRGRIRPIPPLPQACAAYAKLPFGVCVDVLFKEAWWEGVIFDCDEGAKERRVYFPDEGDERGFKLTDLRVTSEWDEFTGQWRERGVWKLVDLVKEHKIEKHEFHFARRVWSRLKVNYGFQKMISEWTCGAYCVWKEYFMEVIYDMTTKPGRKGLVFPTTTQIHAVKKRKRRSKRSHVSFLNASVLTRSMQKRKDKELSIQVKTRRMCFSEAEDSLNAAADKSSCLTDGHRMQSQSATADASVNTEVSKAGDNGEFEQVPSQLCSLVSARALDKRYRHVRMSQNDSVLSGNPSMSDNSINMSPNICFRRKWQLTEDKLTPKLMPSPLYNLKSGQHTSCDSRITRQVHDAVPLQFQDNNPVYNRREQKLLKQKKVGVSTRYPVHRKERRIRICRRSIGKKKSPKRIKKSYLRKTQETSVKLKPSMLKELEASKSEKEDNPLGSQCEEVQPAIVSCQEYGPQETLDSPRKQKGRKGRCRDSVCLICQYGGELLHCDHCLSSYHLTCIDLQEVPVPDGTSFCPSCQCGLCGLQYFANDDKLFTQECYQCSRQYHVACLNKSGASLSDDSFLDKFCSRSCFEICARLHELLRISNPTTIEGLTWTITRSRRNDCNVHNERIHPLIQVSQVLNVFHECFEPIIEPHTGRDLVADIVYNSGSKFRRLDFHGFYVIALVNGEELVCVATIRIHGQKVAEMPLVATPFKYRRKGMCRLLVDELEKILVEMGVERLVLPAIAQLSDTWVSSFGFAEMPAFLRRELLGYPFVLFKGTTMFQKIPGRLASADSLTALRKLETGPRLVQEIHSKDDLNKRFNLQYKRRGKPEAHGKEKTEMDGSDRNQSTYKCVYKRRRVQASRDCKTTVMDGLDRHPSTYKCVYKRQRIQASRYSVVSD